MTGSPLLRTLVISVVLDACVSASSSAETNWLGTPNPAVDRELGQPTDDHGTFSPAAPLGLIESPLETDRPFDPDSVATPELLDPAPVPSQLRPRRSGFGMGDGDQRAPVRFRAEWLPSASLRNQPGNWETHQEELSLGVPLRIDDDGIWLGLASVEQLGIGTSAVLPNTGLPLPKQLWDIELGVMHVRELGDDWRAGGMVRVGSPSDRPFSELRDMTLSLLAFLTVPSGDRNAWNFSLFYSPTGQIIFPIPGVAYVWRPHDRFQAQLGVPFSFEYRATDALTVTASYRPLTNVDLLVRLALGERWALTGGYRTVNETYWLADREDSRERTYFFDQRLTVGLQRTLGTNWNVELSASYVFDRQVFQAVKFSGPRRDELDIESGLGAAILIGWSPR